MSISVLFRVCYQTPLKNTVKGTICLFGWSGASEASDAINLLYSRPTTFHTMDDFFSGKMLVS
jgi:hypothetical protein